MPRVTAYIPAHNHEPFVGAAIESVLAQSHADFELVVCDDASTDGTLAVIESFRDPRLRVLKNAVNLGASWSARRCLEESTGEFVAPLSSDDAWHPDKLRDQLAALEERPDAHVAFTPPRFIDEGGAVLAPPPEPFEGLFSATNRPRAEWLRRFFEKGNCLCLPSALIRRPALDAVGGFDPRLEQLPDLDLWVRIACAGELLILPEPLLDFRLRSGGANLSAPKPGIGARVTLEFSRILRHFLTLEGLEALGIERAAPALQRLALARRAWGIGTDHHRLFAIDTIMETDLSGLTDAQAEGFLAEGRGWLAKLPEVWLGGRDRYAVQKRSRARDREKLGELRARLEATGGGGSRGPLGRLFSKGGTRRGSSDAGKES